MRNPGQYREEDSLKCANTPSKQKTVRAELNNSNVTNKERRRRIYEFPHCISSTTAHIFRPTTLRLRLPPSEQMLRGTAAALESRSQSVKLKHDQQTAAVARLVDKSRERGVFYFCTRRRRFCLHLTQSDSRRDWVSRFSNRHKAIFVVLQQHCGLSFRLDLKENAAGNFLEIPLSIPE